MTPLNILYVSNHNLCTGCGICEDVCPTKSIIMIVKNGQFVPIINEVTCINKKGCHRCFDACPGVGVKLNELSTKYFNDLSIISDNHLGKYLNCYTGYSSDYNIRYRCASGGVLSQFLIFLLNKKYIDGAVVTAFDASNELLVNTYIAKTKEDVLRARSSKYSPVTMNKVIQEIKKDSGTKFIIVGLPCHIHGFRKYEAFDKSFKEKIIGYFGLYCSSGRTFYFTEYLFKEWGVDKKGLNYFAYRDYGCLGSMVAKGISTTTMQPFFVKEKYHQYFHPLRSFFKSHRCLQCIDHFAELADVAFGDIYIEPYVHDIVGVNSLLVRNRQFLEYLREAERAKVIKLQLLDEQILKKSQYPKKDKHNTFLQLDKLRGKEVPQYDVELESNLSIKSILSYISIVTQIFIGKHKSLWFVITLLKRVIKK